MVKFKFLHGFEKSKNQPRDINSPGVVFEFVSPQMYTMEFEPFKYMFYRDTINRTLIRGQRIYPNHPLYNHGTI